MFGFEYEIVKEYPNYFLDYQERMDESTRWTDQIVSTSGDWSGNVFTVKVTEKMQNFKLFSDFHSKNLFKCQRLAPDRATGADAQKCPCA